MITRAFAPARKFRATAAALLVLALAACSPAGGGEPSPSPSASPSPSPVPSFGPLNGATISAPALANNLLGEEAQRNVLVYLPPQYFTSDARFPVIYYLPGYSDATAYGISIPGDFDAFYTANDPQIVVIVSGVNTFGGSFFTDSDTTGRWSEFVSTDVVGYVDATYRTIPERSSRGIAGHSMGGFGALDVAMRHPEVFGSAFAMAPGLFDTQGLANSQMFSDEVHVRGMIALLDSVAGLDGRDLSDALNGPVYGFDVGYGMAFAPSPEPPYLRYPYSLVDDELVRDDAVWAEWEAGYGGVDAEVTEFGDALRSLDGIGLDCGTNDEYQWIPEGCDYYNAALTAAGIPIEYTTHPGSHGDRIGERIAQFMLPFFQAHLEGAEA